MFCTIAVVCFNCIYISSFMFSAIKKNYFSLSAYPQMIGNISWIIGDKIARILIGLIVTAWLARYLGPDNFGLFNYGLAFVSFFSILSSLGIEQILLRNIVRYEKDSDEILGTTFLLRFAGSTLCVILATISIYIFKPDQPILKGLVFLFSLRHVPLIPFVEVVGKAGIAEPVQ